MSAPRVSIEHVSHKIHRLTSDKWKSGLTVSRQHELEVFLDLRDARAEIAKHDAATQFQHDAMAAVLADRDAWKADVEKRDAEIVELKMQLAAATDSLVISMETLAECSAEIAEMRAVIAAVRKLHDEYYQEDGGDTLEREVRKNIREALGKYVDEVTE